MEERKLSEPSLLEVPETFALILFRHGRIAYQEGSTFESKESDKALHVANSFLNNLCKVHGLTDSIVSNFTLKFWNIFMDLCGVKLKMSSSRHSQTDGASEIMNIMVQNYPRCYCSYNQNG